MLDEGKISQGEYDIVKTQLIQAPAEEWEPPADLAPPDEEIPMRSRLQVGGESWVRYQRPIEWRRPAQR